MTHYHRRIDRNILYQYNRRVCVLIYRSSAVPFDSPAPSSELEPKIRELFRGFSNLNSKFQAELDRPHVRDGLQIESEGAGHSHSIVLALQAIIKCANEAKILFDLFKI